MTVEGIIQNGMVVLDHGVTLPEGARVEVTVVGQVEPLEKKPTLQGLLRLAGSLSDLPADFSAEHDHCIHGTPKRSLQGE